MNHAAYLPAESDRPDDLVAERTAHRKCRQALAAHPDPRDPDYPELPEDDGAAA